MSYEVLGISLDYNDRGISGSTTVYGLIGDPIDHSLSPAIQNAAFRSVGLNSVYVAFPVPEGKLRWAIQGLRSLRIMGFNVTTPHKEKVLRYLDNVDTAAAEMSSINTVTNRDDLLTGFNTDGAGALNAMEEAGISVDGQKVLLLGAGGAGRAIAYTLAARSCSLKLVNRTTAKALRLSKALRTKFRVRVESASLSRKVLHKSVNEADTILNASSMGMDGRHNPPIDKRWIRGDQWVFDIVYRPTQTKLLQDATSVGARTVNGLDMLVNQGACSFTLWTGKKAAVREMRKAFIRELAVGNVSGR
jgi:shikimate dehydrogenase